MNKIVCLILFVISVSNANNEQIGIIGGAGLSKYKGDVKSDYNFSYSIGGFAQIDMSPSGVFKIQPEVLYSMKGASFNSAVDRLHYIDFNILPKLYLNSKVSILAGMKITSILISAKSTVTLHDDEEKSFNVKKNYNSLDYAGLLGGIQIKLNKNIEIGFRLNYGLNNINKSEEVDSQNFSMTTVFSYLF